ncbi:MAG: histidine phosphatase family protein [Patescibacteria group bacterium]
MYIYIFRHGESTDNRGHIFSGWRNPDLSEKGLVDTQELAELLKDKEFSFVYTPNLTRNLKTVQEILKYHPETKTIQDDRIRERSYGDLQGNLHLELMKKDLKTYLGYHRSYETPPPGGESIADVEKRVLPFLDMLVKKISLEGVSVAVCGGNNSLRVIRRHFEKLSVEQMMKLENPFDNYFQYEV